MDIIILGITVGIVYLIGFYVFKKVFKHYIDEFENNAPE